MDGFINVQSVEPDIPAPETLLPSNPSQNFFGAMYIGTNKFKIDGQNGKITLSDGSNTRLGIGSL